MTDRASPSSFGRGLSAEGLPATPAGRALYDHDPSWRAGWDAALRDTGPHRERLALIHRPVTNPMYPRPICEDDGQEWPCKTAIVARLSTPRTETSE